MKSLNLQKIMDFNREVSKAIVKDRNKEQMRELLEPMDLTDAEIQQLSTAPICLSGPKLMRILKHLELYDLIFQIFYSLYTETFRNQNESANNNITQNDRSLNLH